MEGIARFLAKIQGVKKTLLYSVYLILIGGGIQALVCKTFHMVDRTLEVDSRIAIPLPLLFMVALARNLSARRPARRPAR